MRNPGDQTHPKNNDHGDRHFNVAIIGASYAGLSLANTLHLNSIGYTIFDRSLPVTYIVGGDDFKIPSFSSIVDRLDLNSAFNRGVMRKPTRKDVTDILLERVKKNLMPENCVIKIIQEGEYDFHIITESKTNDRSTRRREKKHGPYQSIVGADGVMSLCRRSAFRGIFLVGDARWANDRWYDLGLQRINRGADIAMIDGVTLGEALCKATNLFGKAENIVGLVNYETKSTFCSKEIFRKQIIRQTAFFVLLTILFCFKSTMPAKQLVYRGVN